ncbi:hypothetical protein Dimus_004501 [Dionaea muscipula]
MCTVFDFQAFSRILRNIPIKFTQPNSRPLNVATVSAREFGRVYFIGIPSKTVFFSESHCVLLFFGCVGQIYNHFVFHYQFQGQLSNQLTCCWEAVFDRLHIFI